MKRNQEPRRKRTGYRSRFAPEPQIRIASVALQHNFTLVSADSDFQRIQTVRDLRLKTLYQPFTGN